MNERTAAALRARNRAIIDAVLTRIGRLCPGEVDLVAVFGSFAVGNFREDSDLDLLIVLRDGAEDRISHAFLMGNTAHDLYTRRWSALESAAQSADPFGGKLLDAQLVWTRDSAAEARFSALRETLSERLASPLTSADRETVFALLDEAAGAFGRMSLEEDFGRCRLWAGCFWQVIAQAIYRINRACIRRGVGGMPAEMAGFARLPADFLPLSERLCRADSRRELTEVCRALWRGTVQLADTLPAEPLPAGTVEEAVSNWRGKIACAARENDAFLSLMSAASCTYYYEEMHRMFGVPNGAPFASDALPPPAETERQFDAALAEYEEICRRSGIIPVRYADTDDLMRRYGRGEE